MAVKDENRDADFCITSKNAGARGVPPPRAVWRAAAFFKGLTKSCVRIFEFERRE